MPTTAERPRPKARVPSIREVCLIGDPARRYLHTTPIDMGQGSPCRDRAVEIRRQGKPCPTL